MKIRNGFVSNSSSSSFILKFDETYPDTISIAESMLKNKYNEYSVEDYEEWWKPEQKRAFKNLKILKKEDDKYIPIYFNSCNYNTYIVPLTNNYVFISTCNNTQWDIESIGHIVTEIPNEVLEKYPNSEYYSLHEVYITTDEKNQYGEYKNIIYNHSFYLIEHGIELQKPSEYKICDKCYNDIWVYDNKEFCIKCNRGFIIRINKINKILSKNIIFK